MTSTATLLVMSERRRLSPDDRRAQLLDIAKSTVERHGVSACTVERVAEHAGVTSQLVHKYFGTRMSLLGALLEREDARYQSAIRAGLAEATSFRQVVRVFVAANLDLVSGASAIGQLRGVPELADRHADRWRGEGRGAERVLVQALTAEYVADRSTTEFVLRLGSAASIEAADIAGAGSIPDRDAHIDRTVRFIIAGVEALATKRPADQREAALTS